MQQPADTIQHEEDHPLHGDILSKVLSCLPWTEVLRLRCVSSCWKQAALKAHISELSVQSHSVAEGLEQISQCLVNVESLKFVQSAEFSLNDQVLSRAANFVHLKHLSCSQSRLENSFPQILTFQHLETLDIRGAEALVWSLSDLVSLSRLRRLRAINNRKVTGKLRDLAVLSRTLVTVELSGCERISGNLMDMATFPHLKELGLDRTLVTGDLRHIRPGHFPSLEIIGLDKQIYGANELRSIADAHEVMRARYQLCKQSNRECPIYPFLLYLSKDSSDFYYGRVQQRLYSSELDPPFHLVGLHVGTRWGWRWTNLLGGNCDIHWMDPEPVPGDEGYDEYVAELDDLMSQGNSMFAGYLEPPTSAAYDSLCK